MKSRGMRQQGFTIIEVVLFLAVTGLMLMGIFVAISSGINRQYYEDTIVSLVDQFQGQYNLVDNVRSNRSEDVRCVSGGFATSPLTPDRRGTSNCAVIGRLVTSLDGSEFRSVPVFATNDVSDLPEPANPSERAYIDTLDLATPADPTIVAEDTERYTVPWDHRVYINGDLTRHSFSLLIIKLPSTGMVRTYAVPGSATASIPDLLSSGNDALRVCVDSGMFGRGGQSVGVRVLPLAPNVSGVQRIAASETEDAC